MYVGAIANKVNMLSSRNHVLWKFLAFEWLLLQLHNYDNA